MIAPSDRLASLPPGAVRCVADKGAAHHRSRLAECPHCVAAAIPSRADAAPKVTPRNTAGHAAEDALARQFAIEGWSDTTERERDDADGTCFRRQHPWGLALNPRRGFAADFAFLELRVLVEIDGGAHYAGREKGAKGTERSGLAASLGWVVVTVTPKQVASGNAMDLARAALAAKEAK